MVAANNIGSARCASAAGTADSKYHGPAGRGAGRSTRSGAAAGPSRPGCSPPRTCGAPPRRSAPASSTGPHPTTPRPPGRRPAAWPVPAADGRRACTSPGPRLWRPARPGPQRPAPAATGSPTSATPGSASPPTGHWPPPRLTPPPSAAPAPGGPAQPHPARHHPGTSCFRRTAEQASRHQVGNLRH
jgi:hypothetical protein